MAMSARMPRGGRRPAGTPVSPAATPNPRNPRPIRDPRYSGSLNEDSLLDKEVNSDADAMLHNIYKENRR